MKHQIETYHLHAYLDGALSEKECREVERALRIDNTLSQQLHEFKAVKQQVTKTYAQIKVPERRVEKSLQRSPTWQLSKAATAASLLLGFVVGLGVVNVTNLETTPVAVAQQMQSANYLVHLDSDTDEKQH